MIDSNLAPILHRFRDIAFDIGPKSLYSAVHGHLSGGSLVLVHFPNPNPNPNPNPIDRQKSVNHNP